jgi:23S rRNA (guanosine2251-2'-O)-methyltransferase
MKPGEGQQDAVYGVHPVEEALRGGRKVLKLLVKDPGGERAALISAARERKVPVHTVSAQELDRLAHGGNHQGAAALLEPYRYVEFDELLARLAGKAEAVVVLLDAIKDPGNFGAILRTAAAAGADGVVILKDRAVQVTPAAYRASAGAADRVAVCRVVNLARAMDELKKHGFWIYGTAADRPQTIWQADWRRRVGLVLGEEEKGMRRLVGEHCDETFAIPMPGRFESLNVAAAAAVCLFEAVRQRRA